MAVIMNNHLLHLIFAAFRRFFPSISQGFALSGFVPLSLASQVLALRVLALRVFLRRSPGKAADRKPIHPVSSSAGKLSAIRSVLALIFVLTPALPLAAASAAESVPSLWLNGEAQFSCPNLKAAFEEYRGDMDLTHTAFAKSLINLSTALREVLKKSAASQKAALSKIIQDTEAAVSASYADQDTVSQKGFDIQDALEECLK